MATGSTDGDVVQGFGAQGGKPSPVCRTFIYRAGEEIRVKPHRLVDIKSGDVMVKISSGGGGVGSALERDLDSVREDVVNELVSVESARDDYGVVIDPVTFEIDLQATRAARESAA